jgi:hypothetical protein
LRKKSIQIRKELVAQRVSAKAMVTSHSGRIYAHNMCCSVLLLYDESETVSKLASKQAENLCLVRTEILANVNQATDTLVAFLTKSRLHEIEEHVQHVTARATRVSRRGILQARGARIGEVTLRRF